MSKKIIYILGIFFLIAGIYTSIYLNEPHFYSLFSIGAFLILLNLYNSISEKPMFHKWGYKNYFFFFISLLILSIIIDKIGLYLGYWTYQYITFYDEILKYVFEWVTPFIYIFLSLLIGIEIFKKIGIGKKTAFLLSLIIFVTLVGFVTEFFNYFSNSWTILKMPIANYSVRGYFIVFQTIGYWLMAIITLITYKIIEKLQTLAKNV